ncbi:MAG: hypothetical protein HUJ68_14155, partial [Clostridia bacterium]|nr:hypothetical protein [Clostridia bacterium]
KFNIANVRPGTNGKYAIIGRSMGPAQECAEDLSKFVGKENVYILDDAWLHGKKFTLGDYEVNIGGKSINYKEGYKIFNEYGDVLYTLKGNDAWTVDMAWNDMANTKVYDRIKKDRLIIDINELKKIPMFKVNKIYIEELKYEGYEILDIGNPLNQINESLFYNMELEVIGF